MKRFHDAVIDSWSLAIARAMLLGEGDAAYKLTRGLVRRLRELGLIA